MEQIPTILKDTSSKVSSIVKKTDKFLTQNLDLYDKTKVYTKVLYDVTKLIETNPSKLTLPELIIEDFDPEQIWAGIEIQNQEKYAKLESKFSSLQLEDLSSYPLLVGKPKKQKQTKQLIEEIEDELSDESDHELSDAENFDVNSENEDLQTDKNEDENSDEDILNDPDFQNMSDSDGDDLPLFNNLSDDELENGNEDNDDDQEEDVSDGDDGYIKAMKEKMKAKDKGRKSEIDDQFFKLSDMEKFHDIEDPRDILQGGKGQDEDEEDLVDLFDEIPDEDDSNTMYKDFWVDKNDASDDDDAEFEDNDDESEEGNEEDSEDRHKTSKLLPSSDEEDEDVVKSSHEVAQERLAKKISKMEEAAVGEKSWQMGGEVSAPVRPENSLLSEHLDYDTAAKQAPVITEEVSRKLEDIILQRIKDKAWDDVERKVKPVEDPYEYKKKLVLDQEKSKLSLAQIYEEEFLKVAEQSVEKKTSVGLLDKDHEETPEEVKEIKSMMNTLFRKLDSLSHLHFTPKQNSAELKVIRNIPSIAMEEVAPVAATNAVLLAPNEVVDKQKGELMDDKEKTQTDRKREKREKKAKLKAKIKDKERKEKLVSKLNPGLGNKYSKEKALKQLEEAEKQGKVINLNKKNKDMSVKNSKSFFSNLQDEVSTHVREKAAAKKSKDKTKNINVASLKL